MTQTTATQPRAPAAPPPSRAPAQGSGGAGRSGASVPADTRLRTLSQDFFSLILMIRRGSEARNVDEFLTRVADYFRELEAQALAVGYSMDQVRDAQYALCAFLDESVLGAGASNIRQHLELHPLQYTYFGVHLAGEGFFERLEALRTDVKANLDVLEVYHLSLALGFEGKFRLEHRDQLRYVASTLGQDIARYRQTSDVLAPGWQLPDQVGQLLRYEIPVWVYLLVIALCCGAVYLVLDNLLDTQVTALIERLSSLFATT
jgi:type VI secretion system protein ImpK